MSDGNQERILIVGAGLSGLSAAYFLAKSGRSITLLESKDRIGGVIRSEMEQGHSIDHGANSAVLDDPRVEALIHELGLDEQIRFPAEDSAKRYLYSGGKLHGLKPGPKALFSTELFNLSEKIRILSEPFRPKRKDKTEESVHDFFSRRFGKAVAEKAVNAVVAGIFAGDASELSMEGVFPKLLQLESEFGSVIKGLMRSKPKMKRKIFTFEQGMSQLTQALEEHTKADFRPNASLKKIESKEGKWFAEWNEDQNPHSGSFDRVVLSTPAYTTADLIRSLDEQTANALERIPYAPIRLIHVAYDKRSVGQVLDGFGFLVPAKEPLPFLGAIWGSTVFPHKCPTDQALFTLFVGGTRSPERTEEAHKTEVEEEVLRSFESVMKIGSKPRFTRSHLWTKAIPQYSMGHRRLLKAIDDFEQHHPGLHLMANYRSGVSVGDRILRAMELAQVIA